MWRSCSAHVHGNSPLKVWHDLHRLAFFKNVRVYSSHASDHERPAAGLVWSDAQRSTIYALSTHPGKAGIAVVRISGPDTLDVWRNVVKPYSVAKKNPEPWKMERCRITDSQTHEIIDDGLAVFFKAPRSFTTQDVLELHIHSGRAIISSVLNSLSRLPFCRPAEAGEFTRRAFEGGRLDLTQVEGLKDLIDAETECQRRLALRIAEGTTRAQYNDIRQDVIKCLAMVEALIDFGEGEDIEQGVYEQAREQASYIRRIILNHLSDSCRGEILRSGIRLAIFGPPNVGKSTLLNFLAQREAAIVTSVPGTTRDILELSLDIGGLPVIVADTAGLRHSDDVVESIGVDRAKKAVLAADVSLCVLSLPEAFETQMRIPRSLEPLITPKTFFLLNKSDLVGASTADLPAVMGGKAWPVSLSTGEGTKEFLDNFSRALQKWYDLSEDQDSSQAPLVTHARHRTHLESALQFLEAFLETSPEDIVLGAEELRYAAQAIGKVSGLIDVEDVLDAVFRDFCIGK